MDTREVKKGDYDDGGSSEDITFESPNICNHVMLTKCD